MELVETTIPIVELDEVVGKGIRGRGRKTKYPLIQKIMSAANKIIRGKEYYVKVNKQQQITEVWDDIKKIYEPYDRFLDILKDREVDEETKIKKLIEEDPIEIGKVMKPKLSPKTGYDKRTIAGRLCGVTLVHGNIDKVYDSNTKTWLSLNDFENRYEPKKNVKNEVDTSKTINEVVQSPIPEINITATTNTGTASSSGTATFTPDIKFSIPIPKTDIGIGIDKLKDKENEIKVYNDETDKKVEVKIENSKTEKKVEVKIENSKTDKKVEVKVDDDKTKEKKEEADPYNWYINETLRLKK